MAGSPGSTSRRQFGSMRHLAGRFAGSLLPYGPPAKDELWAKTQLLPDERTLWDRMSGPDRRHAVGVARRTVECLGGDGLDTNGPRGAASREVVAAALLHDVGKVEAGLGTWARSGVTLAAMAVGRERLAEWGAAGAPKTRRRRIGRYLTHDRVGAELLSIAGSDPFTVAWAAEHHQPRELWSVEAALGDALKDADDD